ncbi:MAG TPA: PEGA domain-containing protein [Polyangiaceae bacterium]|nr:PEGA domain-containing protein [Polyangiaceae bacterium]
MTCGQARPRSGLFGALVLLAPSLALAADPPAAPAKPAEAKPSQGKPAAEAKKRAAPEAPPEPPKAEQPPAPPAAPAPPSDPNAPPAAAPTPPPPPAEPPKAEAPPPKAAEKPAAPKKAVVVDEAKRAEAAHRFDRGLQLFEGGDNAGALAEFKRTYEILPNPVVLYNIGLVYAAMSRPVEAVDALEPAIASGGLSPKQLERAKPTLADQKARVGRLTVTTKPEGARVEVDNVEVARTPLGAPIRISEGSHIVGAVAEGFAPARKEVVVAGNSDANLHFELVPTLGKLLANLTIRTTTVGADVYVNGEVVGKTPLPTSVTLVAGHYTVELRRPGYVSAKREVDVGSGATGDLAFDLAVDPAALGADGATLVLDSSETPAELTVDGERKGPYSTPLRLPRGPHHISVAAAGFIPLERDVNLDGSQTNVVKVVLEPTPETRKAYRSTANFHRTWGWIGIASGVAIAGGSTAFALVNMSKQDDAQSRLDAANALNENDEPPCDASSGYASQGGDDGRKCFGDIRAARDDVNSAKTRSTLGFIGMGVGGAVAITGVVLLLTGNDPDKYERPAGPSLARNKKPRFALAPGPGEIGTGLSVAF